MTLHLHPLPDSDRKTANRKTKYRDGNAGAHPREEGTLIGEMVAGEARVGVVCRLRILRRFFNLKFLSASRMLRDRLILLPIEEVARQR
jgi:hypothetical protein